MSRHFLSNMLGWRTVEETGPLPLGAGRMYEKNTQHYKKGTSVDQTRWMRWVKHATRHEFEQLEVYSVDC